MTIRFTFDYELFVNDRTGDIDHCLIIPTRELLAMFDRQNVKATFFIDMAYAYRLRELMDTYASLKEDYRKFCQQVKEIADKGHEVALHLHPQWFYADYDGVNWIMDFDHYKLSDMPLELANERFDECYQLLCEISGYNVVSFRAGGFSIQDYQGFYDAMRRNGIKNDSSVLFGEKQITKLHSYDYSSLISPELYHFSNEITTEDSLGEFCELPIATIRMSVVKYILYRLKWKYIKNQKFIRWGNGGDLAERQSKEFKANVKRRFEEGVKVFASVDGHFGSFIPQIVREYRKKGIQNITVLGHPKLASHGSIKKIEQIILRYKNSIEFKTINQ